MNIYCIKTQLYDNCSTKSGIENGDKRKAF